VGFLREHLGGGVISEPAAAQIRQASLIVAGQFLAAVSAVGISPEEVWRLVHPVISWPDSRATPVVASQEAQDFDSCPFVLQPAAICP